LLTSNSVYIGIDLAWGDKNLSGFCVLSPYKKSLKIIDIKLLKSIDDIVYEIQKYHEYKVYIGLDAPLLVPNEDGNRECEKNFNRDFAKYKIAMLPVNRKLLTKYNSNIRSEDLYTRLRDDGFKRDYTSNKVIFEVYPHSTIAMLFNNHQILPYKRKKDRNTEFIREQLTIYKKYLAKVVFPHTILKSNVELLKGQGLKGFEDMLDAITCAYIIYFCQNNEVRFYKFDDEDIFVTPISPWKVYMLRCADDTLYTGVTTDLQRRVNEHNTSNIGAKYTRNRRPVELIYFENCDEKKDAMRREYAIKQLSRKEKLKLVETSYRD
jgi:predicted GIY-YIG superfamily endonuclease/predicted RNase H-like nuclease